MTASVQRYVLREGQKARERAAAALSLRDTAIADRRLQDARRQADAAAFYAQRARLMDRLRRFDLARSSDETGAPAPDPASSDPGQRASVAG